MDGPVVASIITASVALAVAVGGAVRGLLQSAVDRRYDWRRQCLVDAQSAMLALREALQVYGSALGAQTLPTAPTTTGPVAIGPDPTGAVTAGPAAGGPLIRGAGGGTPTVAAPASFAMNVPDQVQLHVSTARGRFAVSRSRLDDPALTAAYDIWNERAGESLISAEELQVSAEEAAFAEVNRLTGAALQSLRGTVPRRSRR